MNLEEAREIPLEEKIWQLRDEIVQKLIGRGGDPEARVQGFGVDVILVATNEERNEALVLGADGKWGNIGYVSYPIVNPSADDLIEEFAKISDSNYYSISLEYSLHASSIGRREQNRLRREVERNKRFYLSRNRTRLTQEFMASLETTLQALSVSR